MRKAITLFAIVLFLFAFKTYSQNVNVNPGGGSYATLGAAFTAINNGVHTGAITIVIVGNTNEGGVAAILNASGTGSASYTSIVISPSGGVARTITGNFAGGLVDLNGADFVTIDGLNTGGNTLTIQNTSIGAASALLFHLDASNNIIQNCSLQGSGVSNAVVTFSGGTVTGNDGNTISNCQIGPAGANLPINGIFSTGTSAVIDNSGNTITGCYIFDYFSATNISIGINLANTGNSDWTITNNRLFQTATRTFTSSNTHNGINILVGSGYTITGNIIGFANATGTGTTNIVGNSVALAGFPAAYVTAGVANATRYIGISCSFTAGGTVSNIQNNTIGGFALFTSSGATTTNGIWCGIKITSGNVNIGTTTTNTIGATSGLGSVYTACTTTGGTLVGIYATSTNTVNIQNNTIGGCDAVGTTAAITGGFTGIDCAGAGAVITVNNNTIGNSTADNIRTGYTLSGANLSNAGTLTSSTGATSAIICIRNAGSGQSTITSNTLRGIVTSGTVTSFTGITITGSQATSCSISSNLLGTAGLGLMRYFVANSGALAGIVTVAPAAAAPLTINSNDFRGIVNSVAGSHTHIYINWTHGNSVADNVNNNTFTNLTVNTIGSVTFLNRGTTSMTATGSLSVSSNSIVTQFTKSSAGGTVTCFTNGGGASSPNGSTILDNLNNFSNITCTGITAVLLWSNSDGPGGGSGPTKTISNNTFSNITTGAAQITGITHNFSGNGTTVTNNTLSNFIGAGVILAISTGTSCSGALGTVSFNTLSNFTTLGQINAIQTGLGATITVGNINNNTVTGMFSSGAANSIFGMIISGFATTTNIFKNKITNIQSDNAGAFVYGTLIQTGGTTYNVYDNTVGDLRTPSTNAANNLYGYNIGALTAATTVNLYYNTVYLNATSTGALFGSSGIFASTTPTLNLVDNIVVNTSTPNGGALTVAYIRNANSLGTYAATSNNNDFYAGAPSATNLIFNDGTNSDQTLSAYQSRVSPRDNVSISELPPFISTTPTSTNLHINTGIATQVESGGTNVGGINDDIDNDIRQGNGGYVGTGTAPDIGSDEFNGIPLDLIPPAISYTALGNGVVALTRSFTSVTITDLTGVNTTAGTKPRCYYKKSGDLNDLSGWKFVEANGITTPFDFTINYATLNAGSVTNGDIIQYFVVAQDIAATPNVGINSGTFATSPSSVNLTAAQFPLTGTINQYTIAASFSGTFNVGVGQTYTSFTAAGGLFQALNAGVINGPVTAQVTSDITIEDGTNTLLNPSYDVPGANYQIKIIPKTASLKTISGSVAGAMINLSGGKFVKIDGDNGFGSKFLTFRNTSGTGPTFQFQNEARQNIITNCTIEGNNTGVLGTTATIVFAGTTGTLGNDSNTISFCDIRDRTDIGVGNTPICALFSSGTTSTAATFNDFNTITNCNIINTFNSAATFVDMYIVTGNANWTITNNSYYQTTTRSPSNAVAYFGMIMATSGVGGTISGNYFGGTAPLCGGTPMTFTDCGGVLCFRLFTVGNASPTVFQNNTISNINMTTTATTGAFGFFGLDVTGVTSGNVNVVGNTIGAASGTGNITVNFNGASSSISPVGIGFGYYAGGTLGFPTGTIQNNTVGSITFGGTSATATTITLTGIGVGASVNSAVTVSGNSVGNTTANSFQNAMVTPPVVINAISNTAVLPSTGITITGNTIQNVTNLSTNALSSTKGILFGGTAPPFVTSNIITEISDNSANATGITSNGVPAVSGIFSSTSSISTITSNTISGMRSATVGAFNTVVNGIKITGSTPVGSIISRNRIFDLTNTATGVTPDIVGIFTYFGNFTCANNQISITNGEVSDIPKEKIKINTEDNINNGNYISSDNKNGDKKDLKSKTNNTKEGRKKQDISPVIIPEVPKNIIKSKTNDNDIAYFNYAPGGKDALPDGHSGMKGDPLNINGIMSESPFIERNIKKEQPQNQSENDVTLNGLQIQGIHDEAGPDTWNYYYNTVYIGGSATTGANATMCYSREAFTTIVTMKNNLFINARTGNGSHYAISNYIAGSITLDYNSYMTVNTATMGRWVGVNQTFAAWQTSSAMDKQSWSTTPTGVNPLNLLTNVGTGNLNIQSGNVEAWFVSGKGIAIVGQNTDYTGNARVTTVTAGCTDIGANEFAATPPGNFNAIEDFAPGSGVTSTYSLWGRNIAQILWGAGGVYPGSMTVNYYSGVVPSNTLGGNYSQSHTTIVPTGSFSGTTATLTYFFGDNETFTITSPGSNTILAKYDPASWEVFQPGAGTYQTQLTYNLATQTFSAKVIGITNFSDFALTDVTSALPVSICQFGASLVNRDVNLNWVTCQEVNNKGFDIERRIQLDGKTNTFSNWVKTGSIEGHGTSNEQHTYAYKDLKLNAGKYQYRLKQIDYNGSFEYYNLSNPNLVEVGRPTNADVSQNYPNPSNPKSKIDYQIPFTGKVTIKVYDEIGREVTTIINEVKEAGFYTAEFDGTNIASGIYFYRIIAEGDGQKFAKTLKMVLVK